MLIKILKTLKEQNINHPSFVFILDTDFNKGSPNLQSNLETI